jgi:glycosyltransferase involved in cell wall biosynthesis
VVSTRVAGIPEIVWDGEAGFLLPRADLEALISALWRLVLDSNLRGSSKLEFERIGCWNFDAECNASRFIDLMKQINEDPRFEGYYL